VKDQATKASFNADERAAPARFLSSAVRAGICRADDRGDPVIQPAALTVGQPEFDYIEEVLLRPDGSVAPDRRHAILLGAGGVGSDGDCHERVRRVRELSSLIST
jgi:hypothetical protein